MSEKRSSAGVQLWPSAPAVMVIASLECGTLTSPSPPHSAITGTASAVKTPTNGSESQCPPWRSGSYRFAPPQETDGTRASRGAFQGTSRDVSLALRDEGTLPEAQPAQANQESTEAEAIPRGTEAAVNIGSNAIRAARQTRGVELRPAGGRTVQALRVNPQSTSAGSSNSLAAASRPNTPPRNRRLIDAK
jgi:hypothetical protein